MAVDEFVTAGLLFGEGTVLRFRHEIVRLAVEQSVAGHHRAATHARILAVMGNLGCDEDASMALHAEAAGDAEAVLHYAHSAARRAAELASHREAAAWRVGGDRPRRCRPARAALS